MAKITTRMHIEAVPDVVFEVASDLANAAETFQGIEQLEVLGEGPIGVGTRFRETRKVMGKSSTEEMEITAFDPPHGYTVECETCGALYRSQYTFVGDIAGTHVRLETNCKPITLLAKLMSPLSKLMMGTMKKCLDDDLEDLKRVAEARDDAIPKPDH